MTSRLLSTAGSFKINLVVTGAISREGQYFLRDGAASLKHVSDCLRRALSLVTISRNLYHGYNVNLSVR